jgi:hypothetical protein
MLSTSAFAAEQIYILMERDGLLNVFEVTDLNNPAIMTNIAISLLPVSDQKQLKEGIRVEGDDALRCILEDLGS